MNADKKRKNMLTKSQKEEPINLYIKYGLRDAAVIRNFGYPCRSVLSDCILEDIKEHQTSILKGKNLALNN